MPGGGCGIVMEALSLSICMDPSPLSLLFFQLKESWRHLCAVSDSRDGC